MQSISISVSCYGQKENTSFFRRSSEFYKRPLNAARHVIFLAFFGLTSSYEIISLLPGQMDQFGNFSLEARAYRRLESQSLLHANVLLFYDNAQTRNYVVSLVVSHREFMRIQFYSFCY